MNNKAKFYTHSDRESLIGYCEIHCRTERALFRKDMVAQMIEYAGRPADFCSPEEIMKDWREWYPLHNIMQELVNLARKNKDYEKSLLPIRKKRHLSLVVDNEKRLTQS